MLTCDDCSSFPWGYKFFAFLYSNSFLLSSNNINQSIDPNQVLNAPIDINMAFFVAAVQKVKDYTLPAIQSVLDFYDNYIHTTQGADTWLPKDRSYSNTSEDPKDIANDLETVEYYQGMETLEKIHRRKDDSDDIPLYQITRRRQSCAVYYVEKHYKGQKE